MIGYFWEEKPAFAICINEKNGDKAQCEPMYIKTQKTDAWQIKDSYGWYTWYGPYFEVPSSIQECDNIHVNAFSACCHFQ